jgi:hypothetical protein
MQFPVDWYFRMIKGITDLGSSSRKSELIARQFTGYFIFISFFRADCNNKFQIIRMKSSLFSAIKISQ